MPSEERKPGSPGSWLRHARSDLELARIPRPAGVLYEGLCFHAQQAAEKALKAVLIARRIPAPHTHNIRSLLDLLPGDLNAPAHIQEAATLTDFAVSSRYPADFEPIEEAEYFEAVRLAEAVVSWAEAVLRGAP